MAGHIKIAKPVISIQVTKDPSIVCEGNYYFLEYLEFKLFRFNLDSSITFERDDTLVSERIQATSDRIQEICSLLEHLYPKLYVHVSRQMKVSFKNEVIICDIFRSFCRTLFKTGISWPRIIALFAFAAGIIVDCIKDRKAEFASTVVYCVKAFIENSLMRWIKEQGGWTNIMEHFQDTRKILRWYDVMTWLPSLMWSLVFSLLTKVENLGTLFKGNK